MMTPVNANLLLKPMVQDVSAGGIILPASDESGKVLPCEVLAVADSSVDPDEIPVLKQLAKAAVVLVKMPYEKDFIETEDEGKLIIVDITQVLAVTEWLPDPQLVEKEVTPTVS